MASPSRWRGSRFFGALALLALSGCAAPPAPEIAERSDDTIIVAGRPVHTGTHVVTWLESGGLDAYRTAQRDESGAPASYGVRRSADRSAIAQGDFGALLGVVDQIVLHYDGFGNSRDCFAHLAERQLSAHFLIDIDGTIYQTLDLQERAYHATVANNRSIGIEIANVGAFPIDQDQGSAPLAEGRERPSLANQARGTLHGIELIQESYKPAQYAALTKLIDALCDTLPRIERAVPQDTKGAVIMSKLPDDVLSNFRGILGHFHIQENKVDPGPAFHWEQVLNP